MRRTPSGVSMVVACALLALAGCGDNLHPEDEVPTALDTIAPAQVTAGDVIAITCKLTDADGQTSDVQAEIQIVDDSAVLHDGLDIIARRAGTITVACALPDDDLVDPTPATVTIVAGPPAYLVTTIAPSPATAGDTVTATCAVFDSSGNQLDGQSPVLAISPSDPGNTVTDLTAVMTRAGHYDGQCALPGAESNDVGFDVDPGLPAAIVLGKTPDQPLYAIGDDIAITDVVTDAYGNEIANAMVTTTSTAITGIGPVDLLPPATYSYGGEGTYEVDGTVTGPTEGGLPVTSSTDVIVDSIGPKITCGTPGDGSMVNAVAGSTLTFQGTANDVNGTASVTVNGTTVAINPDGSFGGAITAKFGINFVDVTATDTYGIPTTKVCTFLAASQWADPNNTYAGTIGLSLAQGAVDDGNRNGAIGSLGDLLYTIANSAGIRSSLDSALLAANPLKPEACDDNVCVFGLCACAYRTGITYNSSTIDGPNSDSLTLVSGGIATGARINGVHLNLRVFGDVAGIGFDTSGTVDISYISVGLTLIPAVSGGTPHITVQANSTSAGIGSIATNFSGVDGWIINHIVVPLAQGSLQSEVTGLVKSYISTSFDAALDGVVSGLDISSLGTSFAVPRLYGGGTVPLGFGVAFSSIDTTAARLRFGIGTKLTSTLANAYTTLGVAVPAGTVLGDPAPSPADTAVAVHVALFNQALHALWRANYFTASVLATSINTNAPPDLAVSLTTRLPPVAAIGADGTVQLSIGDVDLALTGAGLPAGLVVTIGARAHTSVTLNGTDLGVGAITLDETHVSLDALNLSAANQQQIQDLIASALPQLISGSLANALPSLPIPSFPIPSSLAAYGLPAGSSLTVGSPALQVAAPELVLRGTFEIQ